MLSTPPKIELRNEKKNQGRKLFQNQADDDDWSSAYLMFPAFHW
jgi:hypothetical protein